MRYFIPALALVLGGCATGYHAKGMLGDGYSDYRITENTFSITFRGNKYSDEEDIRRFALVRAAELTLTHGFRYFLVVNERELSSKEVQKHTDEFDGVLKIKEIIYPGVELKIRCAQEIDSADFIDAASFLSYNPSK